MPRFLMQLDAYLGGSSATQMYMRHTMNFSPNDIDIYIKDSQENRCIIKSMIHYIKTCGYALNEDDTFTDIIGGMYADNNHVKEIWSFSNDALKKNIQFVLIDMHPKQYILEETDISCTSIAYSFFSNKPFIADENRESIKHRFIYLNKSYHDIYDGKCGHKKLEKLMNRIKKYQERGFKFVGKNPIPSVSSMIPYADRQIPKNAKKHMIHSVEDLADITAYAALRRGCIIIYTSNGVGFAVNRMRFHEYCIEKKKTYWGHTLNCDLSILMSPFSIFHLKLSNEFGGYSFVPHRNSYYS
jgi:hypothetical protein